MQAKRPLWFRVDVAAVVFVSVFVAVSEYGRFASEC